MPGFFLFLSTNKRIRGRRLQRIRTRVLSDKPLCVMCQQKGIIRAATEVDHVTAVTHGGNDSAHDDSNRQSLCHACHEAKTREDLGQRARVGCDVNGYPMGDHPWNKQ
jgi:5-methylcytosine-specific restriction enzyme A